MLEVLYSTGLRVSELLNLRISDIDMRIGCVRCIGKGDKERLVPIGRKAIEAVEQYLAQARPKFARPSSPPPHNQVLFLTQYRQEAQPRQHLEDPARLWNQAGLARAPHPAQAAPQFCHAPARRGCGPALGPAHAGPRGYFHDSDLHARGRGALEADLQSASPARVKAKSQSTGMFPWRDKFDRVRGRIENKRRLRPRTVIRMPDYMFQLESRLSPEQRAAMVRIQELATEAEANLYLVGGAVRDMVSGMSIRDLDFTIEGNPSRIIRELEKGGAKVTREDESLRSVELLLSGEVDASISAAREDIYARPGAKPETRFSTIMEDLRRRDFSINAIAISLNPNSRGLLLDPTNGLADLERREIRALSIHSFTNQPVRLLRALRYEARMGFKMESRTRDWFNLAMERELQETISPEDAGGEFRQVAREEKPVAVLKAWESHGLMEVVHPLLAEAPSRL